MSKNPIRHNCYYVELSYRNSAIKYHIIENVSYAECIRKANIEKSYYLRVKNKLDAFNNEVRKVLDYYFNISTLDEFNNQEDEIKCIEEITEIQKDFGEDLEDLTLIHRFGFPVIRIKSTI